MNSVNIVIVGEGGGDYTGVFNPVFAVGITTTSSTDGSQLAKLICQRLDGQFVDLRLAIVTMDDTKQANLLSKVNMIYV